MVVPIAVSWKEMTAFIAAFVIINAGYVWYLFHLLSDNFDKRYMKRIECNANHQVTDMAIVAMREDIKEMRKTNEQILGILLSAANNINVKQTTRRSKKENR